MRAARREGFTLVEMLVVIAIIGVLAAVAIPRYVRYVEVQKFDGTVALLQSIATANRMFALDNHNYYANGEFIASCGAGTCPVNVSAQQAACALVWCKYLADQDWANKTYRVYTCDPTSTWCSGTPMIALATRKSDAQAPYSTWSVNVSPAGVVGAGGTGVPPTQ